MIAATSSTVCTRQNGSALGAVHRLVGDVEERARGYPVLRANCHAKARAQSAQALIVLQRECGGHALHHLLGHVGGCLHEDQAELVATEAVGPVRAAERSEEHTSELQSPYVI